MTDQPITPKTGEADAGAAAAAAAAKAAETSTQKPAGDAVADKPADKKAEEQFLFEKKADDKADAGAKDKAPPDDKAGDKKDDKAAEPEVKFEDLKLPEGVVLPDEIKAELAPVFKELKLDNAQAQKLVDAQGKVEAYKIKQWEDMKLDWKNEILKDPELGGKNAEATRLECDRVIRQFSGKDPKHLEGLQDMLVLLGAGSNPHFVRFLHNVAKATKEDTAAGGGGGGEKRVIPPEERLWPSMKATS